MKTPDFDDIVFGNLNKEYGAYFLRKRYNSVLVAAIILSCAIGCIIVLIPFLLRTEHKNNEIHNAVYVVMENLKHPTNMPGISEPPPAPATPRPRAVLKIAVTESRYVAPKVVDSLPPMEKSLVNTPDSINGTITDLGDINGTGNEKGSLTGGTGTGGNGNGGNGLYSKVEVMPTFKGGDINKFREWVQKKTKYPEIATINGIQGKVYVTFIVEKDGSVTNGKVVKGVDPVIDNEALKSVMSSPKWSPGKERGDAVRVSFIIMLNFQL